MIFIFFFSQTAQGNVSESSSWMIQLLGDQNPKCVLQQIEIFLDRCGPSSATQTSLLTLLGKCLSHRRCLSFATNRHNGINLVRHINSALLQGLDTARSSCYYILQNFIKENDVRYIRYGLLPTTWDVVCSDIAGGNDESSGNIRTNALALTCFLIGHGNRQAQSIPWQKIVDALRVLLHCGEEQHQAIACRLLLEAANNNLCELLLERDVPEYCMDALHSIAPQKTDLLQSLLSLLCFCIIKSKDSFASRVFFCMESLSDHSELMDKLCSNVELHPLVLQLVNLLLQYPVAQSRPAFLQIVCVVLVQQKESITTGEHVSMAQDWIQVAHRIFHAKEYLPAHLQQRLEEASAEVLVHLSVSSKTEPAPPLVALCISLCALLHQDLGKRLYHDILQSLERVIVGHPLVLLEALQSFGSSALSFPVALKGFFNGRRELKSSDPVLVNIIDHILEMVGQLVPWMPLSLSQARESIIRAPDPSLWRDMFAGQGDQDCFANDASMLQLVIALSSCSVLCNCDILQEGTSDALSSFVFIHPQHATPALAILMTLTGYTETDSEVAAIMAKAVLKSSTSVQATHLPKPFLRWCMSMPALEPLCFSYVETLLEMPELLDSFGTLTVPFLLQLLQNRSVVPQVLCCLEQMSRKELSTALMIMKGLLPRLSECARAPLTSADAHNMLVILYRVIEAQEQPQQHAIEILDMVYQQASLAESAHIQWLNCVSFMILKCPSYRTAFERYREAISERMSSETPLLLAQLQFLGLLQVHWSDHIADVCFENCTSSKSSPSSICTSLYTLREMLGSSPNSSIPVFRLWTTMQALVMTNSFESVRQLAVECCYILANHHSVAPCAPWTWFQVKWTLEHISTSTLNRCHLTFLNITLNSEEVTEVLKAEFASLFDQLGPPFIQSIISAWRKDDHNNEDEHTALERDVVELLYTLQVKFPKLLSQEKVATLKAVQQRLSGANNTDDAKQHRQTKHQKKKDFEGTKLFCQLWEPQHLPLAKTDDRLHRLLSFLLNT